MIDRARIDEEIDRLRGSHPARDEFVAAVRAFGETLDSDGRKLLGEALLDREPETGGFDVLNRRLDEGGWLRRTMRRAEERRRA